MSKVRKTTSTQGDVSPSLGSFDRPGNNVSAPNISTAELSSPSLSRVKHSLDTARTPDSLKPEVLGTARSISIDIPLGCGTPKNRPSHRQPYTPMVSSSSPDDTTPENQNKEALATKVKAKRSILGLFSREKARVKTPETAVPKQGFMGATRSSLAKVMRDSKSLSKVHLPRKTESRSEVRSDRTVNNRSSQTGTFTAPDNGRVSLVQEAVPEKRKNTTEMLHDMVDRIEAGPKDSPERLRHVQIAEVCEALRSRSLMLEELLLTVQIKQCIILAAEYTRNANISALEAKKSARDAELHADRAALEFARLNTLLDGAEIDARSMKFIRSLFTNAAAGGPEEETR